MFILLPPILLWSISHPVFCCFFFFSLPFKENVCSSKLLDMWHFARLWLTYQGLYSQRKLPLPLPEAFVYKQLLCSWWDLVSNSTFHPETWSFLDLQRYFFLYFSTILSLYVQLPCCVLYWYFIVLYCSLLLHIFLLSTWSLCPWSKIYDPCDPLRLSFCNVSSVPWSLELLCVTYLLEI